MRSTRSKFPRRANQFFGVPAVATQLRRCIEDIQDPRKGVGTRWGVCWGQDDALHSKFDIWLSGKHCALAAEHHSLAHSYALFTTRLLYYPMLTLLHVSRHCARHQAHMKTIDLKIRFLDFPRALGMAPTAQKHIKDIELPHGGVHARWVVCWGPRRQCTLEISHPSAS